MIRFKFNETKTTQAAAFLLKENGGKMNYMKLIKLLYLADREALSQWERPITGDVYVSMDNGPVLSKVLDKINSGRGPSGVKSYWHKYISSPEGYNVKLLKQEPQFDELSKREKNLLLHIFAKYKEFDKWQMVKICHDILPEWRDPDGTSIPIRVEDILREVKKTERDIAFIDDEVSDLNYVRAILSPQ
ncbi:MAG: Panacea domain-containing protein [Deltaproteobacteria bacterium]|nr:Panacea domain-containing protein [Deltaproteobacteria bacterium]